MIDEQCFTVAQCDVGIRLDVYISTQIEDITRSRVKKLIEDGDVTLNGNTSKAGATLKLGDIIDVTIKEPEELSLEPCDIPIDIVYEDDDLAVINKAQGMVVHPAIGSPNKTLVNCLLHSLKSLSSINGVIRPGIVHRLDKDTSGLLVVAKTDKAHLSLQSQIAEKSAIRKYIALVDGVISKDDGVIIGNIDRSNKDRKLMAVTAIGGRYAETHYKVLERFRGYCLVEYELKTGRTHQIRVHSKHIGHTIVGDVAYGGSVKLYDKGQLLHAFSLSFNQPTSGERLEFRATLPKYFVDVLNSLRGK